MRTESSVSSPRIACAPRTVDSASTKAGSMAVLLECGDGLARSALAENYPAGPHLRTFGILEPLKLRWRIPVHPPAPQQIPLEGPHPTRATSDELLASQAAKGMSTPFAKLVERYAGQVVSVVERATGDHHLARDLTQEVWMKVHRALPSFDEGRRFRPWLFAIAMNHVRDHRRKEGRRQKPQDINELADGPPVLQHDALREHTERDAIDVAMARVPELYRAAIHLVDVLGLDYEEASEALRCSAGTVKSRVHRGRRAFQEAYLGRLPERTRTQNQR